MTNNNKEKQMITKQNRSTSSPLLASPMKEIVCFPQPIKEALASSQVELAAPTPTLDQTMVERALITMFDNGEDAAQRYKLAVRLNLKDEPTSESPEFIAPLSKDPRTFRRYAAPGTREDLVDFHNEIRIYVKKQGIENKPYFGKFHLNNRVWSEGKTQIQVEPTCYAALWFDGEGWCGIIKLYDFIQKFELFSDNLSPTQHKMKVKATYMWQNPKYQKHSRPLTWAERRVLGIK